VHHYSVSKSRAYSHCFPIRKQRMLYLQTL